MDAGTILFQSSGGFGPNLGQIQKELEEFGKVVRIKDTPAEDVPHQARDFDYLLEVKGILHSRYLDRPRPWLWIPRDVRCAATPSSSWLLLTR